VKRLLFFFFVFFFSNAILAQSQADSVHSEENKESEFWGPNDTTLVSQKSFDTTLVKKLKADPELNYKQPPTLANNLWSRILAWFRQLFSDIINGATSTHWGLTILWLIGIAIIVIVVMMLLKVNAFRVFYSGADRGKVNYNVFHENIHEMDFEKLIRDANEKGEYRLGVRLIFLYALKILSDKQMIKWQAGKTNHDYVEELSVKDLKTGLNELSFYFDYAWYGGFSVDHNTFAKVENTFNSWRTKVN
jgi:hypothetical protein